jgi:Kef-type K+ transport system membrane component KefB
MSTMASSSTTGRRRYVEYFVAATVGAFAASSWLSSDLRTGVAVAVAVGTAVSVVMFRRERKTGLPDERQQALDRASLCYAAYAMFFATVVSYTVAQRNGMDGRPFLWIFGVGFLTYLFSQLLADRFQ